MKKDAATKMKLVDRIAVKKQLKNKIFREVEGFRNTGNEFTLVNKVSKDTMKKLVGQIKNRLGF